MMPLLTDGEGVLVWKWLVYWYGSDWCIGMEVIGHVHFKSNIPDSWKVNFYKLLPVKEIVMFSNAFEKISAVIGRRL